MHTWCRPGPAACTKPEFSTLKRPNVEDVIEYLKALYSGLNVEILSRGLRFIRWEEPIGEDTQASDKIKIPEVIEMQTATEIIRIRVRESFNGLYKAQPNVPDLLDVASSILPQDEYAILMLMDHDLYENQDSEDCCTGRAYGALRVARVSISRYHPATDERHGVDLSHCWPASHCVSFDKKLLSESKLEQMRGKAYSIAVSDSLEESPLRVAIDAYPTNFDILNAAAYGSLWLGRVCKTASDELGRCSGIECCVSFACVMQSAAHLFEDNR